MNKHCLIKEKLRTAQTQRTGDASNCKWNDHHLTQSKSVRCRNRLMLCLISMENLCREHGFTFMQVGANSWFLQKRTSKSWMSKRLRRTSINPLRRFPKRDAGGVRVQGGPEDLFAKCFQKKPLVPTSQGPEPELEWCHDTLTPYCSWKNGVAERSMRKIKEETNCAWPNQALRNSGGQKSWLATASSVTSQMSWRKVLHRTS